MAGQVICCPPSLKTSREPPTDESQRDQVAPVPLNTTFACAPDTCRVTSSVRKEQGRSQR